VDVFDFTGWVYLSRDYLSYQSRFLPVNPIAHSGFVGRVDKRILIRITAPHFCAGITNGRAAPILQYMRGWTVKRIQAYCVAKGWLFEVFK